MPASDVPPLGQRIRAERLRRDLSLRALAREVGVSASMISQIETGKAQPSVSTLYAITSILGMSIQDVFETAPADDDAGPAVVPRPTTTRQASMRLTNREACASARMIRSRKARNTSGCRCSGAP